MKSIKPGRGPSMMGGVMGIAMAVFGVFWTFGALGIGAPPVFALFGLVFIGVAVMSAVHNFKNATGKKRYSVYDIVDAEEEPDPLNERFSGAAQENEYRTGAQKTEAFAFCPYCGAKLDEGDRYCGKCGKPVPRN